MQAYPYEQIKIALTEVISVYHVFSEQRVAFQNKVTGLVPCNMRDGTRTRI